jgi:hypothetical protein
MLYFVALLPFIQRKLTNLPRLCVVCPPQHNEKMLQRDEAMRELKHVYEVRTLKDKRGVDLISDVLPLGRLSKRCHQCNRLHKVNAVTA